MQSCEAATHTSIRQSVAVSSSTKAWSKAESEIGFAVVIVTPCDKTTLEVDSSSGAGKLRDPKAKAEKRAALALSSAMMPIAELGLRGALSRKMSSCVSDSVSTIATLHERIDGAAGTYAAGGVKLIES